MAVKQGIDFKQLWQGAIPYKRFVAEANDNKSLWEGVYRTATFLNGP